MSRFRILVSAEIEASDLRSARETAVRMQQMLAEPMVKFGLTTRGVELASGDMIVHDPQPVNQR